MKNVRINVIGAGLAGCEVSFYLANKGYLKIEETEEKGMFSKSKGFRITKIKEYDGNNESERIFFDGLFKSSKASVTASDLYDSFYRTLNKIRAKILSLKRKQVIRWFFYPFIS